MRMLHLTVGLPRSGKSTQAKLLGHPIVEPDAIRRVIHGTPWKANMEPMVWAYAHMMVEALFEAGHQHVTVDATNHTVKRRDEWHSTDWAVKYHFVDTDRDTCCERAISTNQEYLIPVIHKMHQEFEPLGHRENG